MGGRSRSPQKKVFRKDDEHEGNKGVSKSQSASQNMMEVRNLTKMVMEGVGGATRSV